MTEQEIVNILKENKKKGVADLFLPGEVSDWIAENLNNSNLLYLDSMGNWRYFKDADFDDYDNVVFALPDMFALPPKTQTGWVEFDIDQKGNFHCFMDNDMYYFFWANWNVFLTKAYSFGYTAFGGWQYESNGYWLTESQVIGKEGLLTTLTDYNEDCKPAIPIKIRFWRESR